MFDFPVAAPTGTNQAYTLNPALAVNTTVNKKLNAYGVSIALGHRIIVAGQKSNDRLSLLLYSGLLNQWINVNYTYDKQNYIVLNPDQSRNRLGLYLSAGFEYAHVLPGGRVFVQVAKSAQPFAGNIDYPSSFKFFSPLSFAAGYSFLLSKKLKR